MDREHDDLVPLGTASVETKGPGGTVIDFVDLQRAAGIADDD